MTDLPGPPAHYHVIREVPLLWCDRCGATVHDCQLHDQYHASGRSLEAACAALASLVRQEYPDGYSLAEIASTWGDGTITPEQIEALRELEQCDG